MDVGADKIAKCAYAALRFINALSELTGKIIDLAWSPGSNQGLKVIEVYPAATLKA